MIRIGFVTSAVCLPIAVTPNTRIYVVAAKAVVGKQAYAYVISLVVVIYAVLHAYVPAS